VAVVWVAISVYMRVRRQINSPATPKPESDDHDHKSPPQADL